MDGVFSGRHRGIIRKIRGTLNDSAHSTWAASRNAVLFLIRKRRAGSWLPWAIIQQSTSACKQMGLQRVLTVLTQQNLPLPLSKALPLHRRWMVPAVPALPVPSSPLSPRKWLKGRPFFHRLLMEVDRKAGHREAEASCQVHRKQHWIVNSWSSSTKAAQLSLPHFVWPEQGLGYSCP